jgi:hypothetical protein
MSTHVNTLESRGYLNAPPRRNGDSADQAVVRNMGLRVNGLVALVDNISNAPHRRDTAASNRSCDLVSELRVKMEAVLCLLQVVEHLSGVTRGDVLSTITRSVEDLEEIVYEELQSRRRDASNVAMSVRR